MLVGKDPMLVRAAERVLRGAGISVRRWAGDWSAAPEMRGAAAVLIEGEPAGRARMEQMLRRWGVRAVVVVCAEGRPGPEDARAEAWLATIDLIELARAVSSAR